MYRAVDLSSRRYPNYHFFCRVQAVHRAAPMFCCAQALFRRAKAHMGAWNPSQAKEDFTRVMQLDESLAGTRKFFFYTLFPLFSLFITYGFYEIISHSSRHHFLFYSVGHPQYSG
jgi:hypothetical protein